MSLPTSVRRFRPTLQPVWADPYRILSTRRGLRAGRATRARVGACARADARERRAAEGLPVAALFRQSRAALLLFVVDEREAAAAMVSPSGRSAHSMSTWVPRTRPLATFATVLVGQPRLDGHHIGPEPPHAVTDLADVIDAALAPTPCAVSSPTSVGSSVAHTIAARSGDVVAAASLGESGGRRSGSFPQPSAPASAVIATSAVAQLSDVGPWPVLRLGTVTHRQLWRSASLTGRREERRQVRL